MSDLTDQQIKELIAKARERATAAYGAPWVDEGDGGIISKAE